MYFLLFGQSFTIPEPDFCIENMCLCHLWCNLVVQPCWSCSLMPWFFRQFSSPTARINVVDVRFYKLEICWKFNLSFQFDLFATLCLLPGLVEAQEKCLVLNTTDRAGKAIRRTWYIRQCFFFFYRNVNMLHSRTTINRSAVCRKQ